MIEQEINRIRMMAKFQWKDLMERPPIIVSHTRNMPVSLSGTKCAMISHGNLINSINFGTSASRYQVWWWGKSSLITDVLFVVFSFLVTILIIVWQNIIYLLVPTEDLSKVILFLLIYLQLCSLYLVVLMLEHV